MCNFVVAKRLQNNFKHNRYCVVVSKKVAKLAVNRNNARRQTFSAIKEIELEFIKKLQLEKKDVQNEFNFDIVLIIRSAFIPLAYQEKKYELAKILSKFQ